MRSRAYVGLSVDNLATLANLIQQRNSIDLAISVILGRPAHSGHFGEYVAATIFGIAQNSSASEKKHDGIFTNGALAGMTVNVKYGTRRDGNLNLVESEDAKDHPDFYLVLSGPRSAAGSSRGTHAPWVIESVHLFESRELLVALKARDVRPGTAASAWSGIWEGAMIFPEARNSLLSPTPGQMAALRLFREIRE